MNHFIDLMVYLSDEVEQNVTVVEDSEVKMERAEGREVLVPILLSDPVHVVGMVKLNKV